MWIVFSLASVVLFSTIFTIDKYFVDNVFDKSWLGFVTSALATGFITTILFPFFLPFFDISQITTKVVMLGITAGFCVQLSQLFYFQALSWSESDTVAAFGNITPVMLPIGRFFILDEKLPTLHYIGIFILVATSLCFYKLDGYKKTRRIALASMVASCAFLVTAFSFEDILYEKTNFLTGFFLTSIGIFLMGITPLLFKKNRKVTMNIIKNVRNSKILVMTEILNVAAIGFWAKAISLGSPSYVAAIEATIPGATYSISYLVYLYYRKSKTNLYCLQSMMKKWALVLLFVVGVILLNS